MDVGGIMVDPAEAIALLYARPGLYLYFVERQLDGGSFFVNFLTALEEWDDPGLFEAVDLTVAGPLLSMEATGCHFPERAADLGSVFSLKFYRGPAADREELPTFGYLRPLVWFAEHCVVQVAVGERRVRQAFVEGEPVGPQLESPLGDLDPSISFHLTLPDRLFNEFRLSYGRCRRVLEAWKANQISPMPDEMRIPLPYRLEPKVRDENHYSVRITPNATRLFRVTDVFTLAAGGVVLTPGIPIPSPIDVRQGDPIILRHGRRARRATIDGIGWPPPHSYPLDVHAEPHTHADILIKGLSADDVPIGTVVWARP